MSVPPALGFAEERALRVLSSALDGIPERTSNESPTPKIFNVVVGASLGCPIDLVELAVRTRISEYNPQLFSACILRITAPRITCMVFATGAIIGTGARTVADARAGLLKAARIVLRAGHPAVTFSQFRVHNIVAGLDLQTPIALEPLAATLGSEAAAASKSSSAPPPVAAVERRQRRRAAPGSVAFEPELFPAVVLRPKAAAVSHVSALVFVSGRVVLNGARARVEVVAAASVLVPVILRFRHGVVPAPKPKHTPLAHI